MKNSTTNKAAALVIAILLWSYVMAVEKPPITATFEDIPVQIENEAVLTAADLAIAETSELITGVVLEGQRSDLKDLTAEDISASINVMGYSQGKYLLQVSVQAPDKVTVSEIKNPKIQVTIEPLVEKSKPVELSVMNLEEGTEEGDLEIAPQEIQVSGARSRVNSVTAVQATLDASELSEKAKTMVLSATPVNAEGLPVDYVSLSSDEVDVTAKLYRTKEVDLDVAVKGSPGNGMELEGSSIPSKVTIKGPKGDLKDIDSIKAETIDISGITDNTTVKLQLILPEHIEVSRASQDISATFSLRDIVRKDFTYASNEITIEGLSSDYTLSVETPSIRVMVSGPANVMNGLVKTDLSPVIYAGDVDSSTSQLPVTINHTKNLNSISISPGTVNVSVDRAEVPGGDAGGGAVPTVPGSGQDGGENQDQSGEQAAQ